MIYVEQICNDTDDVKLFRQKNHVDSEWYGIFLEYTDKDGKPIYADNENWIFDILKHLNDKEWSNVGAKLNVYWDKKAFKDLRKVLRSGYLLDWFDSSENIERRASL